MSQPLPVSCFEWMKDVRDFKVQEESDESPTGYILQVDLEYPPHLHDTHNDYPLAPEHLKITCEMTSTYSQALGEALHYRHRKVEKLVPNLHNKGKYILHHRNLKLYLDLRMKLSKIHRVLQFKQEPWLK